MSEEMDVEEFWEKNRENCPWYEPDKDDLPFPEAPQCKATGDECWFYECPFYFWMNATAEIKKGGK